jgi:hypothetical protein
MMGWDWHLKTASSTDVLFIPGDLWCWPWYDETDWGKLSTCLSQRSGSPSTGWWSCQQRHLWQPPVLSGGPAIRDISGASGRVGERNENLVYPSPWDFKRYFTCLKILRYGTFSFTFHPKEGVLRILWPSKIHRLGRVRIRILWV